MNAWVWSAIFVWVASIATAFALRRSSSPLGRSRLSIVIIGTGAALALTHFPSASEATGAALDSWAGWLAGLQSITLSLYYATQAFAANIDVADLLNAFRDADTVMGKAEAVLVAAMHATAPLLLVGVLMQFLQTFSASVRYALRPGRDASVFSELNDQSLALATSIQEQEPKTMLVFTNVVLASNEPSAELISRARALGAIFFKRDALSSPIARRWRRARLRVFVLGDDESANAWYAAMLMKDPRLSKRDNTDLYVYATTIEGDLALTSRDANARIRVRRVNPARTMVYDWLWRDHRDGHTAGVDLFRHLASADASPVVEAAIVGLGAHGTEMLRALSWYCRMTLSDGQRVRLRASAFDYQPDAESRLRSSYPGLFPDEAHPALLAETDITIHGGVDVTTATLVERLRSCGPFSFIFISVGDDARNVRVAVELFRECVRLGRNPDILAVSRNSSDLDAALESVRAEASRRADGVSLPTIHLVGDTSEVFSYDAIIQSDMELNGLVGHLAWAEITGLGLATAVDEFWASEYSYASSIAVPIHWKARRYVGAPGATRQGPERTDEEHDVLQRLEHDRWSSFLLSEGFVPGDYKNAYLIRTHPLLVPYDALPPGEAPKDDNDSLDVLTRLKNNPDWAEATASSEMRTLMKSADDAVSRAASH